VANLGIPHLPMRQTDGFPARIERGVRVIRAKRVVHRRLRQEGRVAFLFNPGTAGRVESPTIANDEHDGSMR
jgi:hypothetical protein